MRTRIILLVICLMGLSIFAMESTSYAQTTTVQGRVYATAVTDSTSDFKGASLAVDLNLTNYAYINALLGVLTTSSLTFEFPKSGKAGDAVTIQIKGGGLLSTSVLNNITLRFYDSTGANVANVSGSGLLQLNLLSSADSLYSVRYITDINSNFTFKKVKVELNNLLSVSLLSEFRIYGMFFQVSCPAVRANAVYAAGTNTSPTLLAGYVTNSNNAADNDLSTYATMVVPLNLLGILPGSYLDLSFGVKANAGEYVGFTVSQSSTLLSLSLLGNLSITALDENSNTMATKIGFSLADLKLLSGTTNKYTIGFVTPAGPYTISRLKITMTGVLGVLESINVHDAFHYKIDVSPVAISASGSLTMCNDSTVVLTANMPTSGNTFQWSNGATTPSITVNASGTYSVSVTDGAGCVFSSVPVTVTELAPIPATINSTNVKCHGENNGTAQAVVPGSAGPCTYLWNTGGTSPSLSSLAPGTYSVAITSTTTGCINNFQALITEPAQLNFSATVSEETCNGNDARIVLTTSGGTGPYTYSTSGMVQGNEVIGLKAGNYVITVTDMNSCKYISSTIPVTKADCTTPINIHDVITPNEDGYNDMLVIEGIENYPASDLMVFDKWGDMVYEENHYSNTWKGSSKSKDKTLPAGTYFYLLKLNAAEVPQGKNEYTGYILIQR